MGTSLSRDDAFSRRLPMEVGAAIAKGGPIAKALNTISQGTGRMFSIETKTGRLEVQKIVYLLQRLDYPSARKFSYNIYLNGPYSPDLAEVYYALGDSGIAKCGTTKEMSPRVLETVRSAWKEGPDFLEGLTTVLDGNRQFGSLQHSLRWAQSIKPHLTNQTWSGVRSFLDKRRFLTGST